MALVKSCAPSVEAVIRDVMAEHHPQLAECEVRVGAQFVARDDDKPVPPLSHQGYPALAVVKKTRLEDRLDGAPDARIQVDKAAWDVMPDDRRIALIDHELTHLEVMLDEDGGVLSDDAGRPKLKLRRHDFQVGVFDEVIARHGEAAVDLEALRAAKDRLENPPPFGSVEMPAGVA